jgi:glycogen debranching enzyme
MAYLARAVGDEATVERCLSLHDEVRARIEKHFWVQERQEYVWRIEPDLSVQPQEPAHSYVALEMGLLGDGDAERIALLFDRIESPRYTCARGIIHPGTRDFVMPIQNAIVALAEFRCGRPDKGLWYLERMAELAGHYMPWAIPEFTGPRGCFLQAWSSAAYNWLLVQGLVRLNPDPVHGTVLVQPQLPTGWDEFHVRNLTLLGRTLDLHLARGGPDGPISFSATAPGGGEIGLPFHVVARPALPVPFV